MSIKVGDKVKCFVNTIKKNGGEPREVNQWVSGIVYHVGDTVLAFETDNGHIYGVKIEAVTLA
jgi:hypothetical protein